MIRNLRASGMALVAVLTMSAVVATAAQAQFTASSYPKSATTESAVGNETFATEAGVWQCKTHYAFGPVNAATTTVTVTPTVTGCTAFGFGATFNMNGCDYVLHDTANNHQNNFSINCPTGKSIVIVAGPCEVEIPAQGPLGNVILTTSGSYIDMRLNLAGMKYNVTKDGFLCPFKGTGAKGGASYVQHNPASIEPIGGGSISVD